VEGLELADFEPTIRKYTNLNTKELAPSQARSLVQISKDLRAEAENDVLVAERKLQEVRLASERKLQAAQVIDDYNPTDQVPKFLIGDRVRSVEGVVLVSGKGDNGTTTVKWNDNYTSVIFDRALELVERETLSQGVRHLLEKWMVVDEDVTAIGNMVIAARRKPGAPT
jgi:hypothetical protein